MSIMTAAVISAMVASMVGSFHMTYLTFVDPSSAFSLELSIQVVMFALIGGLGTVAGPIAGTFLVLPIAVARGWLGALGSGMHGLIYGLVLVAVVLTIPQGLAGALGGGAFIHTTDRAVAEQIALQVADQTDLRKVLHTEARNLTVGGMKRLEVARALATRPRILLLDEVMVGLNPTDIEKSIQMIRQIRDTGVSVLMIEHMMRATMALSDRIIVLNEGAVLANGVPQEVVENPAVTKVYLGEEYQDA